MAKKGISATAIAPSEGLFKYGPPDASRHCRITAHPVATHERTSDNPKQFPAGDTGRNMRFQKLKIGIVFAAAAIWASAQWLNYSTPGTPRAKDGKPNLSSPTPRASTG